MKITLRDQLFDRFVGRVVDEKNVDELGQWLLSILSLSFGLAFCKALWDLLPAKHLKPSTWRLWRTETLYLEALEG